MSEPQSTPGGERLGANRRVLVKLLVVAVLMFGFGYAMVPMYRSICNALGINVLSLSERTDAGLSNSRTYDKNTQIDASRSITIEFDANARGLWEFKPAVASLTVHPGELATVMYEFRNTQDRTMAAQAIPSYAPNQAMRYFNKLECFCFNQYTLKPGEVKEWPVVFVIDPKLPRQIHTIMLSYTFFEVGGQVPPPPDSDAAAHASPPRGARS